MLAGKTLPMVLRQVLSNPRILKMGRAVSSDLKYLHDACNAPAPFVGAIDLAKLAKERQLVKTAKCGLDDLCASVLSKRLNKNVSERVSTSWEDDVLTSQQVKYAALDAYASLQIYYALAAVPLPQPLPPIITPMTTVLIFGDSSAKGRPIARGLVSPHCTDRSFDGINITPTRTLIDIQEAYIPAAILATHRKTALSNFGPPPFTIVCLQSHLRIPGGEAPSLSQLSFESQAPSHDDSYHIIHQEASL